MNVIQSPQITIIIGIKTDGLNLFNAIFVKGSNTEYDTKNIDNAALYFPGDI